MLRELSCQRRRVGALGDRRIPADVRHQHGHRQLLGLADRSATLAELGGQAAREHPAEPFAVLLALDDRRMKLLELLETPLAAG